MAGWVAGVASCTYIGIALYFCMMLIRSGLIMCMTTQTSKSLIVGRIGMTGSTRTPGILMCPGIDGEKLRIMIRETGIPPGIYIMAIRASR